MKLHIITAFSALALALTGCQTINLNDTITAKRPTSQHKKLMVEAAKGHFYDPYSIRDAALSNQLMFPNGVTAYCGRLNAKNLSGGYTGRSYILVSIKGGLIVNYVTGHPWCKSYQDHLQWNRFRELERL